MDKLKITTYLWAIFKRDGNYVTRYLEDGEIVYDVLWVGHITTKYVYEVRIKQGSKIAWIK